MDWLDRHGEVSLISLGMLAIAFTIGGAIILDWSGLQHLRFSVVLAVAFAVFVITIVALSNMNTPFGMWAAIIGGGF